MSDVQERVLEIIRNRVDKIGVSEPQIQTSGKNRIVVDLPGFTDVDQAKKLIGETAQLQFKLLPEPDMIQDLINSGLGDGRFITILINRQRSGVQLSWEQAENLLERKIDQIFTPVPELAYQAAAKNIPIIQRPEESMTADQFRDLAKLVLD